MNDFLKELANGANHCNRPVVIEGGFFTLLVEGYDLGYGNLGRYKPCFERKVKKEL